MRKAVLALSLLTLLGCVRQIVVAPPPQETPLIPQPKSAQADPALPVYLPEVGLELTGTLTCIGSDSMDPLLQLWADNFRQMHPKVAFAITSKGSGTAPKALLSGEAILGHMSREMDPQELQAFEAKFGYAPTRIVVAVDALAIYVNANNPIRALKLEEVDAIFSTTRKGGHPADIATWGGLGLGNEWGSRTIQPYGRDERSGTRAFFREHVLRKGEFKPGVKALPDQFALVEAPAVDASGISYGPVQHSVRMVRAVPILDFQGKTPMVPTVENILNGKYPLTRMLYVYVNRKPGTPLPSLVQSFLHAILSFQGQSAVAQFGAIPLPADMVIQNRSKLKLSY